MPIIWLAAVPAVFNTEELARACDVAPDWIDAHLAAEALLAEQADGAWRFDSAALVRARRIAQLEVTFDSDPQLAALTVDLLEEVARLRRQVQRLRRDCEDEVLDT